MQTAIRSSRVMCDKVVRFNSEILFNLQTEPAGLTRGRWPNLLRPLIFTEPAN